MFYNHLKGILEALLFVANEPLTCKKIAEILEIEETHVALLIGELQKEYSERKSGLQIIGIAGGFQLCTRPECAEYIEKLCQMQQTSPLSQAGLETLAIITYKQPITRAEIEAIRGVKVDTVLHSLIEKKLVQEVGRKDGPGRPILYGTTKDFLRFFGLNSLDELPKLEVFETKMRETS